MQVNHHSVVPMLGLDALYSRYSVLFIEYRKVMPQQVIRREMPFDADAAKNQLSKPNWKQAISKYAQPHSGKAAWQVLNTFIPYFTLWVLMFYTVLQGYSYWITLSLAVPAAGLLVRIFIFFHDCCHGAFFASRRANRVLGYLTGLLTFTPFEDWQRTHAIHHSAAGDLDRRGTGDIWTLTVDEYLAASRSKRLAYRLFRNPIFLFGLVPMFLFLVLQRFPSKGAGKRERYSVIFSNLAILASFVAMGLTVGFQAYLLIQLPVLFLAGGVGMWMFYIQHQFEEVYWARHENWDRMRAGLEGSSYYKLPKVLQWIVGNIGLHHIHHVRANIPNYNLQRCYDDIPALQAVKPLTIRKSLKSLWLNLWDERQQKPVSFRAAIRVDK